MLLSALTSAFILLARQDFPTTPPKILNGQAGLRAVATVSRRTDVDTRVIVAATFADSSDGPSLRMTLKNISRETLKLWRFSLPWGNSNSMELAAVTVAGRPLDTVWLIDDPPPPGRDEPIKLLPGSSLSGIFRLSHRLPSLDAARRTSEVIVLWVYELHLANGAEAGHVSGVIVAPKRE